MLSVGSACTASMAIATALAEVRALNSSKEAFQGAMNAMTNSIGPFSNPTGGPVVEMREAKLD